jgi:phosphoadenosine phosphosulfate reductase
VESLIPEDALAELNARFETAEPQEILRWALLESGLERVAVASAFQSEGTAILHMAARIRSDVPVLFLETGFHFAETLAFKERLTERLGLNVVDLTGDYTVESQAEKFGPRLYERNPDLCCDLNKVIPFNRALRELDAWVTGMRRDSSFTRADTPILDQYEMEPGNTLVKVNPIANWTRRDAWAYLKEHDLPRNPLYDMGYASIGCAPCTRMVFPGEDERAGRWSGVGKIECGIHTREADGQAEPVAVPDLAGKRTG